MANSVRVNVAVIEQAIAALETALAALRTTLPRASARTNERADRLRTLFTARPTLPMVMIVSELNNLPGPPLTVETTRQWAYSIGLKRPPVLSPIAVTTVTAPPAPPAPPASPAALPPAPKQAEPPQFVRERVNLFSLPEEDTRQPALFPEVKLWATTQNIEFDGRQMDVINRRRAALKLRPLVIVERR